MLEADHIIRGDTNCGKFSVIAMRGADIVGALSVNSAKEMAMLRRVIAAEQAPCPRRSGVARLRSAGRLEMTASKSL